MSTGIKIELSTIANFKQLACSDYFNHDAVANRSDENTEVVYRKISHTSSTSWKATNTQTPLEDRNVMETKELGINMTGN